MREYQNGKEKTSGRPRHVQGQESHSDVVLGTQKMHFDTHTQMYGFGVTI